IKRNKKVQVVHTEIHGLIFRAILLRPGGALGIALPQGNGAGRGPRNPGSRNEVSSEGGDAKGLAVELAKE
ncbi:MAG: hypothetical protein J6X67_07990, partial [Treponema sp.]|nr:hypothetical protein [Treponema sp.]